MLPTSPTIQFALKVAEAIEKSPNKTLQTASRTQLLAALPELVKEIIPALAKIKQEMAGLDKAKKNSLVSEVKKLYTNDNTAEAAVDIVILLLLALLSIGISELDAGIDAQYFQKKLLIDITDPDPDYWYQRVDTKGVKEWGHTLISD